MSKSLDDLLNEGFKLNVGDLLEVFLTQNCANTLFLSEILRRQLELKTMINHQPASTEQIADELDQIVNAIADQATDRKDEIISKLFLNGE